MRRTIGSILKELVRFLWFIVAVPLLLAAPWGLVLFVLTERFNWKGFALLGGCTALVYWFELAKERGLVFEAAMTTFVWTIVVAVLVGVLMYVRAH